MQDDDKILSIGTRLDDDVLPPIYEARHQRRNEVLFISAPKMQLNRIVFIKDYVIIDIVDFTDRDFLAKTNKLLNGEADAVFMNTDTMGEDMADLEKQAINIFN